MPTGIDSNASETSTRSFVIRLGNTVAWLAAGAMLLMMLWLAGRPIGTPDIWFHLKAGEMYLHQGLWPKTDPTLFTGLPDGPVQHEWLFGVFAYLVQRAGGFAALRIVHALMVWATLWLVAWLFRSGTKSWSLSALATATFLVLSYPRLEQFRPDLWSIPATLLIYRVLLRDRRLSRRRVLACVALFWVWCNAHSLASLGLLLLGAGALGVALELAILSSTLEAPAAVRGAARARLATLAAAIALLSLVGLVHPRGPRQLFTFFYSSVDTAIWRIDDEWHAFDPFVPGPPNNSATLPPLGWALADLALLSFAAAVVLRMRALKRQLSVEQLLRFDPALFMVATASCAALLISVRFLWLGFFPLLYALRACKPSALRSAPAALCGAFATSALLCLWPGIGRFASHAGETPRVLSTYLQTPFDRHSVADEGVQFLRETAVSGRIFSPYEIGAYLGYCLAPRVRTFIDSRTEHYSAQVFDEWATVTAGGVMPDGRDYLRVLDDRQVDFFFGVGPPGYSYAVTYTLARLERVPGWLLVFRNAGQAIFLRDLPRNLGNLERIQRYYERLKIPFDAKHGLDVAQVIANRLDWAIEQRVVPRNIMALVGQAQSGSTAQRRAAATRLADALFVAGDFRGAAQQANAVLANRVDAQAATIALAALTRAGDAAAAQALFERLLREHGSEPWMQRFRH